MEFFFISIVYISLTSRLFRNPNQETKFGALTMTSALSGFIMRHPDMKKNMEQFVIRHVIPEFSSPNGWMRAAVRFVPNVRLFRNLLIDKIPSGCRGHWNFGKDAHALVQH